MTRNVGIAVALFFFFASALIFGGQQGIKFLNVPPPPPALLIPTKRIEIMVVTAYDPWDWACVGVWAERNRNDPALHKKWSRPGIASANGLLPLGTRLWIPDINYRGGVDDNGGDLRKDAKKGIIHVDLRLQSHPKAMKFGRRIMVVFVSPPEKRA